MKLCGRSTWQKKAAHLMGNKEIENKDRTRDEEYTSSVHSQFSISPIRVPSLSFPRFPIMSSN